MPLYRNRFAALLAILAIAMQAFWPLIAQAKPALPGERVPVCTIEGITHYIELPAPDSAVEKSSAAHHEHCKMCVFGAAKLAVIASAQAPLALGSTVEAAEPSLDAASSPSTFDRPAQPRAPPSAS